MSFLQMRATIEMEKFQKTFLEFIFNNGTSDENVYNLKESLISLNKIFKSVNTIFEHLIQILNFRNYSLSPLSITEALFNIKSITMLELPFDINEINAVTLDKVVKFRIFVFEKSLFIEMNFPLVSHTKFKSYKMISFPVFQNCKIDRTAAAYVQPRNEIIVTAPASNKHMFITENYLRSCTTLNNMYICKGDIILETDETCEFSLLRNPSLASLQKCEINVEKGSPCYFIRTTSPRRWLISILHNTKVTFKCFDKKVIMLIKESGIVEIPHECSFSVENQIYLGSAEQSVQREIIIPKIPLIIPKIDEIIKRLNDIEKDNNSTLNSLTFDMKF